MYANVFTVWCIPTFADLNKKFKMLKVFNLIIFNKFNGMLVTSLLLTHSVIMINGWWLIL